MIDEVKIIFEEWADNLPILRKLQLANQILFISKTLIELSSRERRIVKEAESFLYNE